MPDQSQHSRLPRRDGSRWIVPGQLTNTQYIVDATGTRCSCLGFCWAGTCGHIKAVAAVMRAEMEVAEEIVKEIFG
jgi:hypothetical protein